MMQTSLSCTHACLQLQIQLERRKLLMLQQQLDQLTNKLGTTRSAMGSIFSAKEKTQALQKQIKILENRLEKQYIKYNEVCQPVCQQQPLICRDVCWARADAACAHSAAGVQSTCVLPLLPSCRPSPTTSSCASRLTTCGGSG